MAKKYKALAMRNSIPESEPVTEVTIIPIIDISLVLLVILFVSAPMMSYPDLKVALPKSSAPQTSEKTVAVTYSIKGEMAVGSVATNWETLDDELKKAMKAAPGVPVMLRVDKGVAYRIVAKLIAASKNAGAKTVALGTEPIK